MHLVAAVAIAAFLGQRLVQCDDCDVNSLHKAFPNAYYLIYGLREDKSAVLLPSDLVKNDMVSKKLSNLLDDSFTAGEEIQHFSAMLIEVRGLLQFITIWQEAQSTGKLYTITRISYFEAFRLVFAPTPTKIVHAAMLTTLVYFSDLASSHFTFKTTADNRVFLHQTGEGRTGSYEIVFGRTGTKLYVDKILKNKAAWVEPISNLMAVNKKTTKWLARRQTSSVPVIDCVVETKHKFGVGILYGRKNLVDSYYQLGNDAFNCNKDKCREELRSNGGKTFHDKEVAAFHKKESIYLGFRNGYIFSYKVTNEKEKFSEILFLLDLAHRPPEKEELDKNDDLYLFSIDGKETVAVICGRVSYYRVYQVNPRSGHKIVYLKKSEMTIIKNLNRKCRKVDYDARNSKLIFFIDQSTAHELPLTFNHDGVLKKYPDPKLVRFDNYRGIEKPYEGIESQWPLQIRNGRTLLYNKMTKAIEMTYEIVDAQGKTVPHTSILTSYGNYVKALSYFPVEYVEDEYVAMLRENTTKFPLSYFGITNCTVFVVMRFEDFEKVNLGSNGCDQTYKMRAVISNSHIIVFRTKDDKNVEAVRIKVSVDYAAVEAGIKGTGIVAYTRNLLDSDFGENNSFTIAPNTFDTIHNIGDYTYYQYKPRKECTYYFQKRKVTMKANKEIEDITFPILSVSYTEFMKQPCNFEMSSAMYDESARGVIYMMRSKTATVMAIPNTIVSDVIKFLKNRNFMDNFIYSTAFPYVLYKDPKGPSVISMDNPDDVRVTFQAHFDTIGIYKGKILYRETEATHVLHTEQEAVEEQSNDTVAVTNAVAKRDFEKAAFGVDSEIIGRSEFQAQKCNLLKAPFFMAFLLKVAVLDLLLALSLTSLIIYHRASIIPARRRFKIKMGILRHRKKRKLRDRARRRLRKLNLLRRRKQMKQQEMEARQQQMLAAAVGQLGAEKKKSGSTSSSDLITAKGELLAQSTISRVT